jgi:tripartite-type tricarboxylate transporter receptor subunit TctC
MRRLQPLASALVALALTGPVLAQPAATPPWPQKTVRFIVPLPPGSATDVAARLFAERLSERWRQPVVVENRQGADGIIGVTAFRNTQDGHTLLFSGAGPITVTPYINDKLPYDPALDLVPIVRATENSFAVAVPASLKVDTLAAFVGRARAEPGKLTWAASPGIPHIALMGFLRGNKLDMPQAPYRDFNPALVDLGEGRIQIAATGIALLLPQAKAGRTKLIAVNNRERSPLAPEVPTALEAGYPELTFEGPIGLYGWRDMPSGLKDQIAADLRAVAADPDIERRLAAMGSMVRPGTPAEFAASIAAQRATVAAITKATSARASQ